MKPSAAATIAIIVVALVLIALVIRNDQSVEPVPTRAPELPPVQPTTSWLTPALGPEPNAYDPNRWWQPSCDPNDPNCPRR